MGVRRPARSFPELPGGQGDRAVAENGSAAAAANPTATLINATVLHGATASTHRVSGCSMMSAKQVQHSACTDLVHVPIRNFKVDTVLTQVRYGTF